MMKLQAHAKYGLERARWFTNSILDALDGDDWFHQPGPMCNHALWIVGHLGLADNMFASRFRPKSASKPENWDDLFWFGSQLKQDRSAYPSVQQVRDYFDERRQNLLAVIDELSDDELSAAGPPADERSPIAGAPNVGQLLLFASSHESMHAGQLTVIHRGLGNPPLFAP